MLPSRRNEIESLARQFEDFKRAEEVGAIKTADTLERLAEYLGLPSEALTHTVHALPWGQQDQFGRTFGDTQLTAPFCGVKVTGALFSEICSGFIVTGTP